MQLDLANFGDNISDENSFKEEKEKLKIYIIKNIGENYRKDLLDELKLLNIEQLVFLIPFDETDDEIQRRSEQSIKKHFDKALIKLKRFVKRINLYVDNGATKEEQVGENFIHINRVQEIRNIVNLTFDTTKLIKILEEINICSKNSAFIGALALCRALLNHIPPIFGAKTFEQVASEFPNNSHRTSIVRLQEIMRKIADFELHEAASTSHTIPNSSTVKFQSEFDILLQEIIKKLS